MKIIREAGDLALRPLNNARGSGIRQGNHNPALSYRVRDSSRLVLSSVGLRPPNAVSHVRPAWRTTQPGVTAVRSWESRSSRVGKGCSASLDAEPGAPPTRMAWIKGLVVSVVGMASRNVSIHGKNRRAAPLQYGKLQIIDN